MSDIPKRTDLMKAIFPTVKSNSDSYMTVLEEELNLLGLSGSHEELYGLAGLVLSSGSLAEALERLDNADNNEIREGAQRERLRLEAQQEQLNKQQELKAAKRAALKREAERKKTDREQLAQAVAKAMPTVVSKEEGGAAPVEYQDYTIIHRMGDDSYELRSPVRMAMNQGWVPLGGIHIAGPLENGVMLFSQAMGIPKGRPKAKQFEF